MSKEKNPDPSILIFRQQLLLGFVNALVGLVFLPLRTALSGGDSDREGYVFYLFAAVLAGFSIMLSRVYRV